MPQAKKKQATKTNKKMQAARKQGAGRKAVAKTNCRARQQCCCNRDRNHIYIVTALSMITAILLCADIAMMTL